MIEELNEIILYLSKSRNKSIVKHIETNLITRFRDNLEWQSLSSSEKHEKRKNILKAVKKYKEEDGLVSYTYENAVISFYDLATQILEQISALDRNILISRLGVILKIDMESIDSNSRLIKKVVSPTFVYESIFKDLSDIGIHFTQRDKILEDIDIISPSLLPPDKTNN